MVPYPQIGKHKNDNGRSRASDFENDWDLRTFRRGKLLATHEQFALVTLQYFLLTTNHHFAGALVEVRVLIGIIASF